MLDARLEIPPGHECSEPLCGSSCPSQCPASFVRSDETDSMRSVFFRGIRLAIVNISVVVVAKCDDC